MKKIHFLTFGLMIFLIIGIGFAYYTFNKKIPVTEIKDSPFSQYMQDKKETFTEDKEWYEVKITYPKDNQKVRDQIFSMWRDFSKENLLETFANYDEAKKGLEINVEGLKYSFFADYKLVTSSSTISYVYEIYTFTGGAHGGTQVLAITINDKLETLSSEQILPEAKLKAVSELAYQELLIEKRKRMSEYMSDKEITESLKTDTWIKEGTAPNRDNYKNVWYEGEDLVISFGQYQVGPYAEGMYEIKIPKSSI